MTNEPEGNVYLIGDDPGMLKALVRDLNLANLKAMAFSCGREFIEHKPPPGPARVVADVCMPGLSGLELQREIARRNPQSPVVFITGHGTIPMSVQAMKAGVMDFLEKPFEEDKLVRLVRQALARDRARAAERAEKAEIEARLATLTPRERQVMDLVTRGLLNKQVASELGATEKTVKVHRARVMRKMRVTSVAELVQAAVKIGIVGI